jgi:hypothetical protein
VVPSLVHSGQMSLADECAHTRTSSTVFGLDVRSSISLPLLKHSPARATGRTLELSMIDAGGAEAEWPPGARTICSQLDAEGAECFGIEASPMAGYRIWGLDRGSYLLSTHGRRLRCAIEGCAPAIWERFLVGQVLPFAALLSGLEIFHASAVVLGDRGIAFVGPSGAGKTSVALEAVRHGAHFLADDVLALEAGAHKLMAHPGAPLAGVDRREADRLAQARRALSSEVLSADSRELLVRVNGSDAPAPLGALFFLDRRASGSGGPRFEAAPDARMLLASTFNLVLDTQHRMRGLLDVCAAAARCRVERVVVGPSVDPEGLACAVIARVSASP